MSARSDFHEALLLMKEAMEREGISIDEAGLRLNYLATGTKVQQALLRMHPVTCLLLSKRTGKGNEKRNKVESTLIKQTSCLIDGQSVPASIELRICDYYGEEHDSYRPKSILNTEDCVLEMDILAAGLVSNYQSVSSFHCSILSKEQYVVALDSTFIGPSEKKDAQGKKLAYVIEVASSNLVHVLLQKLVQVERDLTFILLDHPGEEIREVVGFAGISAPSDPYFDRYPGPREFLLTVVKNHRAMFPLCHQMMEAVRFLVLHVTCSINEALQVIISKQTDQSSALERIEIEQMDSRKGQVDIQNAQVDIQNAQVEMRLAINSLANGQVEMRLAINSLANGQAELMRVLKDYVTK